MQSGTSLENVSMTRRYFLKASALSLATSARGWANSGPGSPTPVSSVAQVRAALKRIADLDRKGPSLHAVIELNPEALAIAAALDRERASTGPRSPLHGQPVLLKDNVATADRMLTTAGSLALAHAPAFWDILGKEATRAGAFMTGQQIVIDGGTTIA